MMVEVQRLEAPVERLILGYNSPEGPAFHREVLTIPVPGRNVTNVAFGGDDRRTLVITEVETGALYRTRVNVPGQRLFG